MDLSGGILIKGCFYSPDCICKISNTWQDKQNLNCTLQRFQFSIIISVLMPACPRGVVVYFFFQTSACMMNSSYKKDFGVAGKTLGLQATMTVKMYFWMHNLDSQLAY